MRHCLHWLAVACSIVASSSAMASATSTAKISNLTFTLYDLNPADDIAPSFQWLTGPGTAGSTATSASVTDYAQSENGAASLSRTKPFLTQSSDITLDNALAMSSIYQYGAVAHGQAAGANTSYSASASAAAGGSYYNASPLSGIELSANTLLIIRADGEVSASIDSPACDPYYSYCYYNDRATSAVGMSLSFTNTSDGINSGNGSFSSQLSATASSYGYDQYNPLTGYYEYIPGESDSTKTGFLSLAFTNNTTMAQRAYLSVTASASGQGYSGNGVNNDEVPSISGGISSISNQLSIVSSTPDYITYGFVASVPEPSTWAIMMMGLVGVAAAARRGRQHG